MDYSCSTYELMCNECGKRYGNRPLSGCPDCLAPLDIVYDLLCASRLGARIGANNLYVKNDAVCFPTLSFKDRVVSIALANARKFGFDTVGRSSTGNLAN